MKKGLLFALIVLCLMLSACRLEAPTFYETVFDDAEPVYSASEKYRLIIGPPNDAQLCAGSPGEKEQKYIQTEKNYEIVCRMFYASDLDSAVHQLTGYRAKELEVLESTRFSLPEYRFAWYDAHGEEGKVCRADVIIDGNTCYAVTVAVRENADVSCTQIATEVFSTIGLCSPYEP